MYGDQHQYKYMTVDDMKSLGDDSMRMDVTRDEKGDYRNSYGMYDITLCRLLIRNFCDKHNISLSAHSNISDQMIQSNLKEYYLSNSYTAPDNVDINRHPITVG